MNKNVLILFVFFACLLFSGCEKFSQKEVVRPVEVIVVQKTKPQIKKTFSGVVRSGIISELSFQIDGQITQVYVGAGEKVKKNQMLARNDDTLYRINVEEHQATLEDAIIQHKSAKNYYGRLDMLHAEGGISENQWDNAKTAMESKFKQIKIARDRLCAAKIRQSYSVLRAPTDGIIVKRLMGAGDYAKVAQSVYVFQKEGEAEVEIYVPQNYLNKVSQGQEVMVKIASARETPFKATVRAIEQTNEGDVAYIVKLKLKEMSSNIKDGMSASADFEFANAIPTVEIPLTALMQEEQGEGHYVWLVENIKDNVGVCRKKYVKTGKLESNKVPILFGLTPNELLIVRGGSQVYEGQRVEPSYIIEVE